MMAMGDCCTSRKSSGQDSEVSVQISHGESSVAWNSRHDFAYLPYSTSVLRSFMSVATASM